MLSEVSDSQRIRTLKQLATILKFIPHKIVSDYSFNLKLNFKRRTFNLLQIGHFGGQEGIII